MWLQKCTGSAINKTEERNPNKTLIVKDERDVLCYRTRAATQLYFTCKHTDIDDSGIGSVRPNYTFALGPFALGS